MITLNKKQVATLVNDSVDQSIGAEALSELDLTGVVDLGTKLANANAYQNFIANLSVKCAKMIMVDKLYESKAPKILMDNFEYGQIIEKVRVGRMEAVESEAWKLVDGTSYDDNVFTKIDVSTTIFKDATTFTIKLSITNDQIKNAFTSANELGKFVSMVFNKVRTELTLRLDNLIMITIKNAIGEVLTTNNAVRACNLIKAYKDETGTTITSATAIFDKDFLRFALGKIKEYKKDITEMSVLFNEEGIENFTEESAQHLVLLSKFASNVSSYLTADTYNKELATLPNYDEVSSWQGKGTANTLVDKSTVKIKTSGGNSVDKPYVIGCLFDRGAVGVSQFGEDVRTHEVKSAKFTNYWYEEDYSYFNDLAENFIVFYLEDVQE